MMGFAYSLRANAIALARARCPIPTPLLVARIIVGFSIRLKGYQLFTRKPRGKKLLLANFFAFGDTCHALIRNHKGEYFSNSF
jgi:hypothetical protein